MDEIPNALVVKYEDLFLSPQKEMERIFSRMGSPVPEAAFKRLDLPSSTSYGNFEVNNKQKMLTRWEKSLTDHEKAVIKAMTERFGIGYYVL